jgi:hypothetical protein
MIGTFVIFLLSGIFLWILATVLYEILRSRKDMLPEAYPFQWIYEITANYDRINDYFVELIEKYPQRSFAIKIFVCIFSIFPVLTRSGQGLVGSYE